jgi:hypothetical protein
MLESLEKLSDITALAQALSTSSGVGSGGAASVTR